MWDYTINGVPLNATLNERYMLLPTQITEGTNLKPGDTGKIVISEELKDFFDAGVGQTVVIEDANFEIAGTFSGSYQSNTVFMSIDDARWVAGLDEGEAQSLSVYAVNDSVIDSIVDDIQTLYPSLNVMANRDMNAMMSERMQSREEEQIESMETDMNKVEATGDLIIGLSMIAAGLIVLFLMLYTVKERTKEIGTLKALGFTQNNIMLQFVVEGLVIGFIGGAAGLVVGYIGAPILSDFFLPDSNVTASSRPSVFILFLGLLAMVLLGGLGSVYPAWTASRKNPVEAMRHE